jgi:hypothetical protein
MYEIKKVHVWPLARSVAVVGAAAALIVPIFVVIAGGMLEAIFWGYGSMDFEDLIEIFVEEEFIFLYVFIVPATALASLAVGALGAFVYNLISEKLGGIQMDIYYLGAVEQPQEQTDEGKSSQQN